MCGYVACMPDCRGSVVKLYDLEINNLLSDSLICETGRPCGFDVTTRQFYSYGLKCDCQ
jgi:hypothetical protein